MFNFELRTSQPEPIIGSREKVRLINLDIRVLINWLRKRKEAGGTCLGRSVKLG
jgi:hypothetical protein